MSVGEKSIRSSKGALPQRNGHNAGPSNGMTDEVAVVAQSRSEQVASRRLHYLDWLGGNEGRIK
jgi:hypothetical protein